jgi:hypothetical protein
MVYQLILLVGGLLGKEISAVLMIPGPLAVVASGFGPIIDPDGGRSGD